MNRQISQSFNISNIELVTDVDILNNINSPKSIIKKSRRHADILQNIMGKYIQDDEYPQYNQLYNKGSRDLIRENQESIIAKINRLDDYPIRMSYNKPQVQPIRKYNNSSPPNAQFLQNIAPNNQLNQQEQPIRYINSHQKITPDFIISQNQINQNISFHQIINVNPINQTAIQPYKNGIADNNLAKQQQDKRNSQNNYPACWFILQILIGYGLTIGFCYLNKVHTFPIFEAIMAFSLLLLVQPNIRQMYFYQGLYFTVLIIIIANNYLEISLISYFQIFICYISVAMFSELKQNQTFFKKLSAVIIVAIQIIFGFLIVPNLYARFKDINASEAFYYVYPFFSIIVRSIVNLLFYHISYSSVTWNQLPLFLTGLDFGIIMTLDTSMAQFWYLMVYLTLSIIDQQRYFITKLLVRCIQHIKRQEIGSKTLLKDISLYGTLTWFHIILLIYLFCFLPIYASPYNSDLTLSLYVTDWFTPLVVWSMGLFYYILSLKLYYKKNSSIFYQENQLTTLTKVCVSVYRGIVLCFGLWLFYLGLGIGNYMIISNQQSLN